MPTLYTVLATLQERVSALTTALTSTAADTLGDPINVLVGIGFPSERTLQNNVRKSTTPTALVTVFDRGLATDTTRWSAVRLGLTALPATVHGSLSSPTMAAGAPVLLGLSGTPTAGDAVALVVTASLGLSFAQVAIAAAGDTPGTMAAQLASLINTDPDLSSIVSAAATDGIVTLTPLINGPIKLACNVGNGAVAMTEIARRNRGLQIAVWTRTEDDRNTVGDVLEVAIAEMEADFGLIFPDGTMGRVHYAGDHLLDDATLADTYRRDFLLMVDYPITTTDQLYAVLAPISRNTTF